jgi:hypothetical protein
MMTEAEKKLFEQVLTLLMQQQATLMTVLENQAVLFEHLDIEELESAGTEFEERRKRKLEALAGHIFGKEERLWMMLENLGIEMDGTFRSDGGDPPRPDQEGSGA